MAQISYISPNRTFILQKCVYIYMKYKSINLKILLTVHCIRGLKFSCWFENNSHMFSLNCL